MRYCAFIILAALCGCVTTVKQSLDVQQAAQVQRIGIPQIDQAGPLLIRRTSPLLYLMGTYGMAMSTVLLNQQSARLQAELYDAVSQCKHHLLSVLDRQLRLHGYQVSLLDMDYWQALKQGRTHHPRLADVDALLYLKIERIGFRSDGIDVDYRPEIIVSVTLTKKNSRRPLYADTLAIGYDQAYLDMTMLAGPDAGLHFPSLQSLLADSGRGRQGLMLAAEQIAGRIDADLERRGAVASAKAKPASLP